MEPLPRRLGHEMLKIGDLVTTMRVENHAGACYRLYDVPERVTIVDGKIPVVRRLVGKFFHDETAIVIEVRAEMKMVRVFTSGGVIGWCGVGSLSDASDVIE